MVYEFVSTLLFILPAYIANMFPVISNGKHPIDFEKKFKGERILGDGKTIEGGFVGIVTGTLAGITLSYLMLGNEMSLPLAFMLSFGAIFGDSVGSFIKRRMKIPQGNSVFPLDQIDFLIGALLFSSFFQILEINQYIFLLLITPVLHLIANRIGYKMKLKKVPY